MRRPSAALVVATAALVMSTIGTSVAATHYVISSPKQIKPGHDHAERRSARVPARPCAGNAARAGRPARRARPEPSERRGRRDCRRRSSGRRSEPTGASTPRAAASPRASACRRAPTRSTSGRTSRAARRWRRRARFPTYAAAGSTVGGLAGAPLAARLQRGHRPRPGVPLDDHGARDDHERSRAWARPPRRRSTSRSSADGGMRLELCGDVPSARGGTRSEPPGENHAQALCGARGGVGGTRHGDDRHVGRRVGVHDHLVQADQARLDLAQGAEQARAQGTAGRARPEGQPGEDGDDGQDGEDGADGDGRCGRDEPVRADPGQRHGQRLGFGRHGPQRRHAASTSSTSGRTSPSARPWPRRPRSPTSPERASRTTGIQGAAFVSQSNTGVDLAPGYPSQTSVRVQTNRANGTAVSTSFTIAVFC